MCPLKLLLLLVSALEEHASKRTYVNTIHALGKLALELDIFWRKFGMDVLIIHFFHLGQDFVRIIVVIIITVVGNVSVALLPRLAPSRGLGGLVAESRETNSTSGLQRTQVGKVELARSSLG